jgi:hypothetical protein
MVIHATMKAKPKERLRGRTMKTDHKNNAMDTFKISNVNIRKNDRLAFKLIPTGTIERVVLVRNGGILPSDIADQGSGQN